MEEINLSFLINAKVLQIKDDELFFALPFVNKVIAPNLPNIDNILNDSAIFLAGKHVPIDSMVPYLTLISSMLKEYGLEDISEVMDMFA